MRGPRGSFEGPGGSGSSWGGLGAPGGDPGVPKDLLEGSWGALTGVLVFWGGEFVKRLVKS